MAQHSIVLGDIKKAHDVFETIEPRGLFYRAATELIELALQKQTSLTVAEALAVLLQTWNKNFYRFKRTTFDAQHFDAIEALLTRHRESLAAFRSRKIEDLDVSQQTTVVALFTEFESKLGPVGAAKTLHLLAPWLFPLWDVAIAKAHGLALKRIGANGDRYWQFMVISKQQCIDLRRQGGEGNLLKAIDEYNYCRYTRRTPSLAH